MYRLILAHLCFQLIIGARSEKAVIVNIKSGQLDSTEFTQNCLTACAAFTEKEKEFNEKISISGNSVFSRSLPGIDKTPPRIEKDICENPFKPAIVYDSKNEKYLIGYELYYRNGKIRLKCDFYDTLKPVDSKNYTISSKPKDNSIAVKYQDGEKTKFCFFDAPEALIFYWVSVLSIKTAGYDKKWIHFKRPETHLVHYPKGECKDYASVDKEVDLIFSEQNQAESLKDIPSLFHLPGSSAEMSCGQAYGCLEKWQIIPVWYFQTNSAKIASCAALNIIPVWKSIANEQLKKVDRFVYAVTEHFRTEKKRSKHEVKLIFGVSEIMKSIYENYGADQPRDIYLTNSEHTRMMAIPEIIYRIIRYRLPKDFESLEHSGWYSAAVIIHNNPNAANVRRLCSKENELRGWDKIRNENSVNGTTYVCPITEELGERLGIFTNLTGKEMPALHLDSVPTIAKRFYVSFEDNTNDILSKFEKL